MHGTIFNGNAVFFGDHLCVIAQLRRMVLRALLLPLLKRLRGSIEEIRFEIDNSSTCPLA
jgi:hypothetical protein